MTFILLLASIAVLEYLVRGTGQKSPAAVKTDSASLGNDIHPGPLAAETATSDLLALGQALNAQTWSKAAHFERVPDDVKAQSGPTQT